MDNMELEYTYWEAPDGWLIGYLNIWPEHCTQGKDIAELEEMLLDLYECLNLAKFRTRKLAIA